MGCAVRLGLLFGVAAAVAATDLELRVQVRNNAGNNVVLANCNMSHVLYANASLDLSLEVGGGFWVLPPSHTLNCTVGCAECFYMASAVVDQGNSSVRIGFGLESQEDWATGDAADSPIGGGMKLEVPGHGSRECTDEVCAAGWTQEVALDRSQPKAYLEIQGSWYPEAGSAEEKEAEAAAAAEAGGAEKDANGTVDEESLRPQWRRPGRPPRRPFRPRRPRLRPWRPYRPPYFPRRPRWGRPYRRRCHFCHQYGYNTCWWLCR